MPTNQVDPETWTCVGSVALTLGDRESLKSNSWLCDRLISAAQQLLHKQHPHIGGLQDPILQKTNTFEPQTGEFVQCLNVRNNHWITVSTVGCTPGVVRVYDSLRMGLTSSLKKAIADMLHTSEKQVVFEHMNMQWQSGSDDCGLFVIATATALCEGQDPVLYVYDQQRMRAHLLKAVEMKALHSFPSKRTRQRKAHYKRERLQVYCECRLPDDGRRMVQCSRCKEWYHMNCIHVSKTLSSKDPWLCGHC